MVRYETEGSYAETNARLVRAVFDELRARAPAGFRYTTYRLPDGVSFVHLATLDVPEQNPLTGLGSFQTFQSELRARCVKAPVVVELSIVDYYDGSAR
jgi:hypothetical protein